MSSNKWNPSFKRQGREAKRSSNLEEIEIGIEELHLRPIIIPVWDPGFSSISSISLPSSFEVINTYLDTSTPLVPTHWSKYSSSDSDIGAETNSIGTT